MTAPLLSVDGLHAWYGDSHILQGVSLAVAEGQAVSVLGRNGAGKTTLLKTIMGLLRRRDGAVCFAGRPLQHLSAHRVARAGIAYVPETRGVFPSLSVRENLTVAARGTERDGAWTLDRVFTLFPRLHERQRSGGGQLSGGEQQMLSIARALMTNGRLLILDEPTEGLAPKVIGEIADLVETLKQVGLAILLVEQNLTFARAAADHVLVLGKGRIRWKGAPDGLDAEEAVVRDWLAV